MNHIPVLLGETLQLLAPKHGDRALDVTLGLGGHSEAILKAIGPKGSLIALDADENNLTTAKKRLEQFSNAEFVHANFRELPDCLPQDARTFDIILADLGLSSPHIDDVSRGFSFRADASLDMRFDRTKGMTAAMLLASLDAEKLLNIFREYGELPSARKLVELLRTSAPIRTTGDLKRICEKMYGYKAPQFLPQVFQALRIAVNDEMVALKNLLSVAPSLLATGGRFAVISYHSLEDALVKTAFRSLTTPLKNPLTGAVATDAEYVLLTKKAVVPGMAETAENPRARSGKLRAIMRP